MPILTSSSNDGALGRRFRIDGLPDFNGADWAFVITAFDGLDGAVGPRAQMVANGGGPGALAVGSWEPGEAYYTLQGSVESATPAESATVRSLLLQGLPADHEVSVEALGGSWDIDKQVFVRRYDDVTVEWAGQFLNFTVPLVAPDPYKYALTPLTANAGAFVPADWFRVYDVTTAPGNAFRTYAPDGDVYYRTYLEDESATSALPKVADLAANPYSVESRRMTITVTGPLNAGEWFVSDDVTGERLWAEVTLRRGQSIVFDCRTRTATIDGVLVNHLVFGDYLTLSPGANSLRLIVGAASEGYMNVEALEAYE